LYLKEGNVKELTTASGKAFQGSTMREKNEYLLEFKRTIGLVKVKG
jgi:hypothetical protein